MKEITISDDRSMLSYLVYKNIYEAIWTKNNVSSNIHCNKLENNLTVHNCGFQNKTKSSIEK